MPFEMVRKEIERVFKETCNQISDGVQQLAMTGKSDIIFYPIFALHLFPVNKKIIFVLLTCFLLVQ